MLQNHAAVWRRLTSICITCFLLMPCIVWNDAHLMCRECWLATLSQQNQHSFYCLVIEYATAVAKFSQTLVLHCRSHSTSRALADCFGAQSRSPVPLWTTSRSLLPTLMLHPLSCLGDAGTSPPWGACTCHHCICLCSLHGLHSMQCVHLSLLAACSSCLYFSSESWSKFDFVDELATSWQGAVLNFSQFDLFSQILDY